MQEPAVEYEELKTVASQYKNLEPFVHHNNMMKIINESGFIPNPEPKITTPERPDPERLYTCHLHQTE